MAILRAVAEDIPGFGTPSTSSKYKQTKQQPKYKNKKLQQKRGSTQLSKELTGGWENKSTQQQQRTYP